MGSNDMGRVEVLLLTLLMLALLQCSYAQPGFLSIDCGSAATYKDPATNITWVPDAGFISTGYNVAGLNISKLLDDAELSNRQMTTLRYFNDTRSKHCYVLPVQSNTTYLVRATFVYFDYDHRGAAPTFDLTIDATFWATINLTASSADPPPQSWYNRRIAELLLPPSGGSTLSVCLMHKSSSDAPIISSLELRPITDDAYLFVRQNNVILQSMHRVNCGQLFTPTVVRYPDDKFDRFWAEQDQPPEGLQGASIMTPAPFPVQSITSDQPPSIVLQSAWTRPGGFTFGWDDLPPNITAFYAALYFAEIDRPSLDDTRIIAINFNGKLWDEPIYLSSYGDLFMVEKFGEVSSSKTATFAFYRAAGSTLDPLINALELYAILGTPNLLTFRGDVDALLPLQVQFDLESWSGDPCLPTPWDWLKCSSSVPPRVTAINLSGTGISGAVPQSITLLEALTDLWLDHNNLTSIPTDFTPLGNLQTLHLQNNRLVGNIPLSFIKLHQLRELFLENNLFNGTFPEELKNTSSLTVRAYGSPYLCLQGGINCKGGNANNKGAIVASVLAAASALLITGVIVYYFRFRKFPALNLGGKIPTDSSFEGSAYEMYSSHGNSPPLQIEGDLPLKNVDYSIQARHLSLDEVKLATNNFKIKIGEGRYGPVFYGQLSPDGQEVAVKQGYFSSRGKKMFLQEIALLSRVRHKSLVGLVAYCDNVDQEMLIFEFMSKGTLRDHLYGNVAKLEPLNWTMRLDIALSSARGLEYLHAYSSPRMVHGDMKSSNVLLNGRLVAQVADFGLSRFIREESPPNVSNTANSTVGYVDPEYYTGQRLTPKSDVFSFGVVLLEMICGREPTRCPDQMHIVPWVKLSLQAGNIHAIVDPSLRGKYNVEAMWHVTELALLSTEMQSSNRPTMTQVSRGLAEAIEIESGSPVTIPVSGDLGLVSVGYNSGSSRRT